MVTKLGRPEAVTDDTVLKLMDAFRHGSSVRLACRLSGISKSTYYKCMTTDPVFSDNMSIAQEWITHVAKTNLIDAIHAKDLSASKWWLEHKARSEFGLKAPSDEAKFNQYQVDDTNDLQQILVELRRAGNIANEQAKAIVIEPSAQEPAEYDPSMPLL